MSKHSRRRAQQRSGQSQHTRGGTSSWETGQSSRVAELDPQMLMQAYRESLQANPTLHHPAIAAGTASPDHMRRDFVTFSAGYGAGLSRGRESGGGGGRGGGGEVTRAIGFMQSPLPQNLQSALRQVIQGYSRERNRY